jgi:hypothetical protein
MPAFRIVFRRNESSSAETAVAKFDGLDQALDVYAARGLEILYIAECQTDAGTQFSAGKMAPRIRPMRSTSFPLRRFSMRVHA